MSNGQSPVARASEIQMDGALRKIPGLENGLQLDKGVPIFIPSGALDGVNAVANQAAFYFPFDATIVAIRSKVIAAPGTAAAAFYVGTRADNDKFGTQSVPTSVSAGDTQNWTITDAEVDAGDVLVFGSDGGATSTGSIDVLVIAVPR